jgi:single-stranded-DNA-specific exonuclease
MPHQADTAPTRWHRGVVGILASRVVDRTGRPALVLAHEDGVAHGSGRSVRGFHLLDALTAAHQRHDSNLFSRFGGHAHAVGFALPSTHVAQLRESLASIAAQQIGDQPAADPLRYDLEIRLADITRDFLSALEQLAPFGIGNPDPLFLTRGALLLAPPRPLNDRHLRLSFADPDTSACFSGVAWSRNTPRNTPPNTPRNTPRRTPWAEHAIEHRWAAGDHFDIAYHLRRNWHPDFGGWELELLSLDRLPHTASC